MVELLNVFLSFGSLLILGCSFLVIFSLLTEKRILPRIDLETILWLLWILSFSGFILPLVYQYFFLYPPCTLCWYQRIFMFPIFFGSIYTLTLKHSQKIILNFLQILSSIGFVFSLYHYFIQMNIVGESALCTTAAGSISCTTIEILEFGFITMPFMAGTMFIGIFTLVYLYKKTAQN